MEKILIRASMAAAALAFACLSGARAAPPPAVSVSTASLPRTVEEAYRPSNPRDPLRTATVYGNEHAPKQKAAAVPAAGIAPSSFSIYNLSLTGIMEDSRSREAMLSDKSTGMNYTLRGGSLFDSRHKLLRGVSGVIKGKQVILMTEDKKVQQLNLHEQD
jgi:hypothetical protein